MPSNKATSLRIAGLAGN